MTTQNYNTDPTEKLYNVVKSKGYYTKSYEDFKNQYNNPDAIGNLYGVITQKQLYTKSKEDFVNQYFPTLKKKESGGVSPTPSVSEAPLPSKKEQADDISQYALQVSPEQMQQFERDKKRFETTERVVSEDDILGNAIAPFKKEAEQRFNEFERTRDAARTESTGQKYLSKREQQKVDRDGQKLSKVDGEALVKLENIKDQAAKELLPDGEVAKQVLQKYSEKYGVPVDQLPVDNETIQAAKRKSDEYDADLNDILATNSIADAAIIAERRANKNFDDQVTELEKGFPYNRSYKDIIPEALYARVVDKFLSKGNVSVIAEKDPDLKAQYDRFKDGGILLEFPTYGATVVANELSRVREEEGKNNWFGNLPRQAYMDNLAQRLYKDDPVKLKIYNEVIREDLPKYIDTPGFLDRGVGAVKHTFKGMKKSVSELAGQDNTLSLYDDLQDANTQVSSEPQGFLHKLSGTSGDFGGLIYAMGVGGSALRGIGISAKAANPIMVGMTFYGDEISQARQLYPDDPTKQKIRAALSTAAFMAMNPLLQGTKALQRKFFDKLMPEVDDVIAKVESGAITREAARDNLLGKFKDAADFAKDAAGKNLKGTSEMVGLTMFKQGVDKVLGLDEQTYKEEHPDSEIIDVAKMTAMGLGLPSIAGASGNKKFAKESLFEISRNPKRYHSVAELTSMVDPEFGKTKEERHQNIEFLAETKNILDEVGLPDNLQKSYLLHAMNEKILTQKAESIKEPTLKKQITDQIKRSQEAKEKILKGENIDALPQEINADNLKENEKFLKEMFDGDETGSFLKAADRELLGGKSFDKGKVPEFLEYVAMQANNVMRGKDGELVTDAKFDSRKAAEERWEKPIIDAANEMFPEYKKLGDSQGEFKEPMTETPPMQKPEGATEQSTAPSIIMPGEIKQPETTTIKPKENEPDKKPKISVILPESKKEPTEIIEIGGGEPPISEPPKGGGVFSERPATELSHRGLQDVANEFSLPDVKSRDKKTDVQLRQDARETVDSWAEKGEYAKNVEGLVKKSESGEILTDKERVILEGHLANVSNELRDMDVTSPEYNVKLAEVKRLKDAGEITRSEAGAALRIPVGGSRPKSVVDAMIEEMDVTKSDILTDKQKETVQREFKEEQSAQEKWDAKRAKLEQDRTERKAQKAVDEIAKKKDSSANKDYAGRRAKLREQLKEAKEEHEKWLKDQGIQKQGFGSLTGKEAKIILEIAKEYVEEGAVKLADAVKKTLDEIKDILPDVTERDVRDVLAGKYAEKKKTRSELAIAMQDLKTEQNLIDKLEQLEKGEVPKSEKRQRKRNKTITDLRNRLKALKSKYAEENSDAAKLDAYKSKMKIQIEEISKQIKKGDFAEKEKPDPLKLDEEAIRLKDRLIKIKNEKKLRQLRQFYENQSDYEKAMRLAIEIANIPRALMATLDFSALLRQAVIPTVSRPRTALRYSGGRFEGSVAEMFRGAASQKYYDRWFADLAETKRFEDMKKSELAITDSTDPRLQAREEVWMSGLADKIPIVGKTLIKGSERAYSMGLNKIRVDLYNRFADAMEQRGLSVENSPEAYKQMAKYINNATGRGDLGSFLNKSAPVLNALFFSPRLIASRVNMATYLFQPRFYRTVPKEVRMAYIKDMAKFVGLGLTVLALAKLMGADVEDDPRSSDFGKIKSGNTRWDIWGGFQQYARVISQIASGQRKSTNTGEIQGLDGEGRFGTDRGDVMKTFLRGKLAPVPSMAGDIMAGRNIVGEKLTTDWKADEEKEIGLGNYLGQHFLPLNVTGLTEALQDQGVKAWFTVGVPSTFGIGVQTYEPRTPSGSAKSKPTKPKKPKKQTKSD